MRKVQEKAFLCFFRLGISFFQFYGDGSRHVIDRRDRSYNVVDRRDLSTVYWIICVLCPVHPTKISAYLSEGSVVCFTSVVLQDQNDAVYSRHTDRAVHRSFI